MPADLDLQQELGKRCRAMRQRKGLSLMDVVKNNEVSLSHLEKIERGVLDPRVRTGRAVLSHGASAEAALDRLC